MEKHKVSLVQKCFYGKACNTFKGYFEFNNHNKSPRKYVLLKVGFFFMAVKYNLLPLETSISQLDLRDKVKSFSKGIAKAFLMHCGIKAKLKTNTLLRKGAMLAQKRCKEHFELNKYI